MAPGTPPEIDAVGDRGGVGDLAGPVDVRGQREARSALEVAAAGEAQPAARRLAGRRQDRCSPGGCASILPELTRDEALEATQLHSVAGLLAGPRTAAAASLPSAASLDLAPPGLLGGGSTSLAAREASLAHRGVLFLDELTEFRRDAHRGAPPAARGRARSS